MRPEGGKIGDGQTQCFAKLDKLSYDNYKYYDGEVEVDSDDSDYSTDSSAGEEDVEDTKGAAKLSDEQKAKKARRLPRHGRTPDQFDVVEADQVAVAAMDRAVARAIDVDHRRVLAQRFPDNAAPARLEGA